MEQSSAGPMAEADGSCEPLVLSGYQVEGPAGGAVTRKVLGHLRAKHRAVCTPLLLEQSLSPLLLEL